MPHREIYDQNYIKKCFDAWFLAGRPNTPHGIKKVIPPHESGKIPSTPTINRWMINGAWDMWADELDAKAITLADDDLVNKKAEMLRQHQRDAMEIATKAKNYLMDGEKGFDSSASAVQAYFKATEEQRKTAGFSDLLERLDKMTNNEVEKTIIERFNRIQANDQIIEVDTEDVDEDIESQA